MRFCVVFFTVFLTLLGFTKGQEPEDAQRSKVTVLNVTRQYNDVDTFYYPGDKRQCGNESICHNVGGFLRTPCQCACTGASPVFYQHINRCQNSVEGCQIVPFRRLKPPSAEQIPVVFLPLGGQILNPSSPLLWNDIGIHQDPSIGDQLCTISSAGYLTKGGWRDFTKPSFKLIAVHNQTFLQWLGDRDSQEFVAGKLILVTLSCQHILHGRTPACISFRVAGTEVLAMHQPKPQAATEEDVPLAVIVGVVCGVLLVLTLLTVVLAWNLCWRRKKNRLVQKMQLQMPYIMHQRMQESNHIAQSNPHFAQESFVPSTLEAYQYQMFNMGMQPSSSLVSSHHAATDGHLRHPFEINPGNGGPVMYLPPPSPSLGGVVSRSMILRNQDMVDSDGNCSAQSCNGDSLSESGSPATSTRSLPPLRKRLYFSPEFLEPDLMADPPPVAAEFLVEVRRMIGMAKNRIRSKRHIPSLLVIPEDTHSSSDDSIDVPGGLNGHDNGAFEASPVAQRSSSNRSSPDQNGDKSNSSNETSGDSGVSVTKPKERDEEGKDIDYPEEMVFMDVVNPVHVWHVSEEDEAVHNKVANWLKGISKTPDDQLRPNSLSLRPNGNPFHTHGPSSPGAVPPSVPPEATTTPTKGATSPAGLPISYSLLRRYGLQSLNVSFPNNNGQHDDPFVLKETPSSFPRKHLPNGRVPVQYAFSPIQEE